MFKNFEQQLPAIKALTNSAYQIRLLLKKLSDLVCAVCYSDKQFVNSSPDIHTDRKVFGILEHLP